MPTAVGTVTTLEFSAAIGSAAVAQPPCGLHREQEDEKGVAPGKVAAERAHRRGRSMVR
jgi:hypothetical protein